MTSNLPVSANIGISANIEAKTEIPSEVSGRAGNALIDAISPFTEVFGLVGDQIRAVRQQRAIDRAIAARDRLRQLGLEARTIPDSFLIPWIEKTSQDEADNGLSEAWTNLLVSAAGNFEPRMRLFPSILAELTGEDVRFLDRITNQNVTNFQSYQREAVEDFQRAVDNFHSGLASGLDEAKFLAERLFDLPHEICGMTTRVTMLYVQDGSTMRHSISASLGTTLDVLESHRLVKTQQFVNESGTQAPRVELTSITSLGFEFVQACRGLVK